MILRLVIVLTLTIAMLPVGAASAQEVTWQDVARSTFIVIGTPVPFDGEYPYEQAEESALQVLDIERPQLLKGHLPDAPLRVFLARDEHFPLHHPYIFLLNTPHLDGTVIGLLATSGAAKLVSQQSPRGSRVFSQWKPAPFTETLQLRLEELLAENERYRKIGAAYRPDPNDPLLALIREDLQAIARPRDQRVQQQSVAKMMDRGDDILPLLIYLVDDPGRFPYGELTIGGKSPEGTGESQSISFPFRMTHAINDLLYFKTGVYMGSRGRYGSEAIDQNAINGWHTYLGRLLSNALPKQE